MREVRMCCGAGYDIGGRDIKASLTAGSNLNVIRRSSRYGIIFSDVEVPGMTKIHDKLYYFCNPHSRAKFTTNHEMPKTFVTLSSCAVDAYVKVDTDYGFLEGSVLIYNFPRMRYSITEKLAKQISTYGKSPMVILLASEQIRNYERVLLDQFGFQVVHRCINPKHNTRITAYYRPPTTEVVNEAKI